jgi:hypothetical protein
MRNVYKILVGKPEGRDHSGDLGVDGKMILELILGKSGVGRCGLAASGSGKGPVVGPCEHSNQPSSSKTGRGVLS